MMQARPLCRQEIENSLALELVVRAAHIAAWLVQQNILQRLLVNEAARDLDRVARLNLRGQIGGKLTIDRDLAGANEIFAAPSGAKAGGGEVTIKAHQPTVAAIGPRSTHSSGRADSGCAAGGRAVIPLSRAHHRRGSGESSSTTKISPRSRRSQDWNLWNIAALWIGMAVCIPTYQLASGLIAQGMSWKQAVLTILLGNLIVLIPMTLNAHPGTAYGVPFPVLLRCPLARWGRTFRR